MHAEINAAAITTLQKKAIVEWKASGIYYAHHDFYQLVEENHAFNYQLWHSEDRARREDMGYKFVYQAKREIDHFNQQRNNRMEAMDEWLYHHLQPAAPEVCPVNSESPGMMIDRLSILALKSYHMALQTQRQHVNDDHIALCRTKLNTIHQQLEQLSLCLQELFDAIKTQHRTFRVYHQFKMYNDPALNPQLYEQVV